MAKFTLSLYQDRLGARAVVADPLAPLNRVIYVSEGMATVESDAGAATLSTNSAWYSAGDVRVKAGPDGARILRYELAPADRSKSGLIGGETVTSSLLREARIDLEPGEGYLMRCDRVDLPPGGIAYTHTHQGPGIRCLLHGGFVVETEGHRTEIAPGEAWFESGPAPVLAWAPDDRVGYFSRVMILPRSLLGKSSISYVNADDADKPKLQRYTIFVDRFITI